MKFAGLAMHCFQPAIATLALLLTPCLQHAEANAVEFPLYGFEIDPLDSTPGAEGSAVLVMSLPGVRGFASNVNVNIQPYKGTMKEYVALSKRQFEQAKCKVITDEQKEDGEWRIEYTATMGGNNLHFYSRALLKGERVYLVTATAEESQWAGVQAKLRKNVDSLKLK